MKETPTAKPPSRLDWQHRSILAGPGLKPQPRVEKTPPLWHRVCARPAVKKLLEVALKRQDEFDAEYKSLLPVIDYAGQTKLKEQKLGSTRNPGALAKAIEGVSNLTPDQLRAARVSANAIIGKRSDEVLALIDAVADAVMDELNVIAKEAREDESRFALKWGLPDKPGPASHIVGQLVDRAANTKVRPIVPIRNSLATRNRLKNFTS